MDGLRSLSQGASTSVRYAQHEPRRKDCGHLGGAGEQHSLYGDERAVFSRVSLRCRLCAMWARV